MSQNHLDPCSIPNPQAKKILDELKGYCPDPLDPPSQKSKEGRPEFGWKEPGTLSKEGLGWSGNCDPMQAGKIVNDPANRNTIYRYSRAFRAYDQAIKDLFGDMVVLDEDGKEWPIPIVWGTQERAVAAVVSDNIRQDDGVVVDRIRLPILAVHRSSYEYNQSRYVYHKAVDYIREMNPEGLPGFYGSEKYKRDTVYGVARGVPIDIGYTLWGWCLYEEDLAQMLEQLILKFSPIAYIEARGIGWEVPVLWQSLGDNVDLEPGNGKTRVLKFEFRMNVEAFIPQPISRRKAVLRTRTEILDGISDEEASSVIARLEQVVKELGDD